MCETSEQRIKSLENEAAVKIEPNELFRNDLFEKNALINNLNIEINQLTKDNEDLKEKVDDLNEEMHDFEESNKKQKQMSNKFNKDLSDARVKFNN